MNRKQWRVICAGFVVGLIAAATVPTKPATVSLSFPRRVDLGKGVYIPGGSLTYLPKECAIALILAVAMGLVFALRGPKTDRSPNM